jgi:prolyl-tRNA editing enzyme YbaK/EbsC (Cys-tRNA(Pro) deacylase)
VFVMDGDPVVVVASGRHRIDGDKVCLALDCAEGRQASPDEVRAATGFPVGGVPPIGHGLPVVFDTALLDYDVIYAAGGDGNTLFKVAPGELAGCVHALVARVGQ